MAGSLCPSRPAAVSTTGAGHINEGNRMCGLRNVQAAAGMLWMVIWWACLGCSGRDGANREPDESMAKAFGRRWAMEVAEDYLRSPSQADWGFWDMTATKLAPIEGRPAWRTSGTLDAPNAFGAKVRMRWTAIVSYDAAKRDFVPEEVAFDDEVAYRRR